MSIIAVNRYYRPDHSATSQMLTDLAEHLAREGRNITIVTSRLRYEGGDLLPARERLDGVDIRRVWTSRFGRTNVLGRAVDYATFYVCAFFALLAIVRRGDIVLAKTDPPLVSVPAALVARLRGAKLVNWCQDLFPEVAGALGMRWADGWAGRALRSIRNGSLRGAAFNAVLHEKMAERLRRERIPGGKIRILPNWADAELRPVAHAHNPLRKAWGLEGSFVAAYSGNLGRAHMPGRVIELVERTRDIEGLVWLFIGGGAGMAPLKAAFGDSPNVQFRPYQPREALSESLSVADMHLVALDPACEGLIVPSKLYGVLAVQRRVLFLGDADGAVARDIAEGDTGVVLPLDQPDLWRDILAREQALARRETDLSMSPHCPDANIALAAWAKALGEIDQ